MAKFHFKYATMNAGKSIDLLKTAYNYEENHYQVLVLKPAIDTKAANHIQSRVGGGIEREVDFTIESEAEIIPLLSNHLTNIKCILIDEAQFLTEKQITDLYKIAKFLDVTVICYGLRTNFKSEFFEGSKRMMELADKLEELVTICRCGHTAKLIGRKVNGEFTKTGKEVVIDGEENIEYIPLCGKCYLEQVEKETEISYCKVKRR